MVSSDYTTSTCDKRRMPTSSSHADAAALGESLAIELRGKRNGQGWIGQCPAHDDKKPSLSISIKDNGDEVRVLLHCFAGCEFHKILAALNLTIQDLWFPARSELHQDVQKRIVATYDYKDDNGALVYQVVRTEPKGFFQRRPDGNGSWVNNLNGVHRVLYHLRSDRSC